MDNATLTIVSAEGYSQQFLTAYKSPATEKIIPNSGANTAPKDSIIDSRTALLNYAIAFTPFNFIAKSGDVIAKVVYHRINFLKSKKSQVTNNLAE